MFYCRQPLGQWSNNQGKGTCCLGQGREEGSKGFVGLRTLTAFLERWARAKAPTRFRLSAISRSADVTTVTCDHPRGSRPLDCNTWPQGCVYAATMSCPQNSVTNASLICSTASLTPRDQLLVRLGLQSLSTQESGKFIVMRAAHGTGPHDEDGPYHLEPKSHTFHANCYCGRFCYHHHCCHCERTGDMGLGGQGWRHMNNRKACWSYC